MPDREVRVNEGVLTRDSFVRVESEEFRQEVESEWVGGGVKLCERNSGLVREGTDVVLCLIRNSSESSESALSRTTRTKEATHSRGADSSQSLVRRSTQEVQNDVQLIDVILPLENRSSSQ